MTEIDNKAEGVEWCFQLIDRIKEYHRKLIRDSFELASLLKKTADEERKKIPFQINVISSAARGHLKETAHSKILYDLLQNELVRKSFMKYFFEGFGIDVNVPMIIPAPDKDRIDVTIRSEKLDENQFFIIIENKVNDAPEAQGQIYRYFHIAKDHYGYNENRIFVLYLNSTNRYEPTDFSMTEKGEGKKTVRDILQNRLVCRSYKYDVKEWLEQELNAESELLKKEDLLQSALQQYFNYLELYFETSKIYNAMNTKLEELIVNELQLNNVTNSVEKLKILNDKIDEVNELNNNLIALCQNIFDGLIFEWKEAYQKKYNGKVTFIEDDPHKLGFLFKYKGLPMRCWGVKDNNYIILGVANENKKVSYEDILFFKNLLSSYYLSGIDDSNPYWVISNIVDPKDVLNILCNLTDRLIEESQKNKDIVL